MAYVGEMELDGVKIVNRDFTGEKNFKKFGGSYTRTFSVEISDPDLQNKLIDLGLKLWGYPSTNYDEPPKKNLNVNVDFRFNRGNDSDVKIIMLTPDGIGCELDEDSLGTLNNAWIKNADLYVKFKSYERGMKSGVTAYCQTLIVTLMAEEERQALMEASANKPNPLYEKYKRSLR